MLKIYAERMARHRRILGFTQITLAELAQTSRNTIARIECGIGSPTWETMVRIADALDVPLDYLAGRSAFVEYALN